MAALELAQYAHILELGSMVMKGLPMRLLRNEKRKKTDLSHELE
jgi:ABC-type branched-subunit amino acid transport system ATPase component